MNHDTTYRDNDMSSQLDELIAKVPDLGACTNGPSGTKPQLLHQHVRRGSEEHAKLVREKARTARAPELHTQFQFLDTVLDFAPRTIRSFVNCTRPTRKIGDDESRVVLEVSAWIHQNFCFDDDSPFLRPAVPPVAGLATQVGTLPVGLIRFRRHLTKGG